MVQRYPELFGEIAKAARLRAELTIETVAERADITERYLYRIENEGKRPSFEVLCRLIRVLSIPADSIFYPERAIRDPEVEEIVHMLYGCDKRSIKIVKATLRAALESQQDDLSYKKAEAVIIE
ncbi:helix-turn-helix transcriptional regulator [uncultured Oscillibacter sp.]|uniref:helix-turn-helix domain-containing protein n=1 Tax=uncultured Oscillibacter sp. TaxID=876091 RepID=UPI0025F778F4|nr:helix-turn-helix transcriptional regulator [uncultured Oscillibacter sp.]